MRKPQFNQQANIAGLIRVDHAGEYGARQIYRGQLSAIKDPILTQVIEHMYQQELTHLNYFEQQISNRRIRPSILMPLWHLGGFALGFTTALAGAKTAMLCTKAVEEVIDSHYQSQISYLNEFNIEHELRQSVLNFQLEEQEHKDMADKYCYQLNLLDITMVVVIKSICKVAIKLSTKL